MSGKTLHKANGSGYQRPGHNTVLFVRDFWEILVSLLQGLAETLKICETQNSFWLLEVYDVEMYTTL